MMETAQAELDAEEFRCRQFIRMNRAQFSAADKQEKSLNGEMTMLTEQITNANNCITVAAGKIAKFKQEIKDYMTAYNKELAKDKKELAVMVGDLNVGIFILNSVKCKKFPRKPVPLRQHVPFKFQKKKVKDAQIAEAKKNPLLAEESHTVLSKCVADAVTDDNQGVDDVDSFIYTFNNPAIEEKMAQLTNLRTRKLLNDALAKAYDTQEDADEAKAEDSLGDAEEDGDEDEKPSTQQATADLEADEAEDAEDAVMNEGADNDEAVVLTQLFAEAYQTPATTAGGQATKPKETPGPLQKRKCTDKTKPNCGQLADILALVVGEFQDNVDKKKDEMRDALNAKNKWVSAKKSDMDALTKQQTECQSTLSKATADKAVALTEHAAEIKSKRILEKSYKDEMKKCMETINGIFFTRMCGIKGTRSSLAKKCGLSRLVQDCAVSDFEAGRCSKPCVTTTTYSRFKLTSVGRVTYTRKEISGEKELGMKCPKKAYTIKCGQFRCKEDCVQTVWSGFGKCSVDCEGGTKLRTRATKRRPRFGGSACGPVTDTQNCHQGTCDRDCDLNKWTKFTGCSQACGKGYQEKFRSVYRVLRAGGKCAKPRHSSRYNRRNCNMHQCFGDEKCMANLDLLVAVDGSGSVGQKGFKAAKDFSKRIINRLVPRAYGRAAVKVAFLVYGNGRYDATNKVVDAHPIVEMTGRLPRVRYWVGKHMRYQMGFSNHAQAYVLAQRMFAKGRKHAISKMIDISDFGVTHEYMTEQQASKLKDSGVEIYAIAVTSEGSDAFKFARDEVVSQPVERHLIRVDSY
jgi:hypothetical protein